MLKDKPGVVSIWVGTLAKKSELSAYVKEQYSKDDEPISRFVADCGDTFCDHDFMESAFVGKKPVAIEKVIGEASYARSFASAAHALATKAGIESANAVILVYDQVLSPVRWPPKSPLRHLGSVPYSVNTPMKVQALAKYRGHDERVMRVAFTPDSKLVATADSNGSMLVWDSATGVAVIPPQQVFKGTLAGLYGLEFSADGSRCLLRTLVDSRLWSDFPNPEGLRKVCDESCVALSPDGTTGYAPGSSEVDVFDLMTGKRQKPLAIGAAVLAVSGDRLIAIADDGAVTVRDLKRGTQTEHNDGPLSACEGVAVSPGGIAVAWDGKLLAGFDVKKKKWCWKVGDCNVRTVAIGPRKKMLVAPNGGEPAAVLEWDTGRRLKSLATGKTRYSDVAISSNEERGLGVADDGRHLDVWHLGTGKLLARCDAKALGKARDEISEAALSPDGNTVVVGTSEGRVVFLRWNGKTMVPDDRR